MEGATLNGDKVISNSPEQFQDMSRDGKKEDISVKQRRNDDQVCSSMHFVYNSEYAKRPVRSQIQGYTKIISAQLYARKSHKLHAAMQLTPNDYATLQIVPGYMTI